MRKEYLKHENLKKLMNEFYELKDRTPDESFHNLLEEIKHSCLIVAGDVSGKHINVATLKTDKGDIAMLFTDMDEYRKAFPNFEVEAHEHPFAAYKEIIEKTDILGYVVNIMGERFGIPREFVESIEDLPEFSFSTENAYDSSELKALRDSINNCELEKFIEDPHNAYDYEGLFELISDSTLLTLMLSRDDLQDKAEDGVISMIETGPLGFLYTENFGGDYATVYTSEDKISNIRTPLNKYSQIVNFSQMAGFILNDDMDGIIINPHEENILLTRDVLLRYYPLLEMTCNDSRLNSAILHMFLIEEQ